MTHGTEVQWKKCVQCQNALIIYISRPGSRKAD